MKANKIRERYRSDTSPGQAKRHARASPTARSLAPPRYGIGLMDEGVAGFHQVAQAGFRGPSSKLPHLARIQHMFGHHDVSRIHAFMGPAARAASAHLRCVAYASGNAVAFGQPPDLRTAAHEAAHIVQQQAGVREDLLMAGDRYERNADAVADTVVRGRSATGLLSAMTGRRTSATPAETSTRARDQPVQFQLRSLPAASPNPADVTAIGPFDLLYGFTEYRGRTLQRLEANERTLLGRLRGLRPVTPHERFHTIDDYNREIGGVGSRLLGQNWAPIGLIQIRNGLRAVSNEVQHPEQMLAKLTTSLSPLDWIPGWNSDLTRAVNAWVREIAPPDQDRVRAKILGDWRLAAWVMMLAVNKEQVGLEDFGERQAQVRPRPMTRLMLFLRNGLPHGRRDRGNPPQPTPWRTWVISQRLDNHLDKNLDVHVQPKVRAALPQLISWWLRRDRRTSAQARAELDWVIAANLVLAATLSRWLRYQALRRTSKLGMDFALRHLNARIHFNMTGPGNPDQPDQQNRVQEMTLNRHDPGAIRPQRITVSEARHLDQLLGQDPALQGSVRLYNE